MAAVVPIEVPAIHRVNGMIATMRMMNGMLRPMFTTVLAMLLMTALGMMWSRRVTTTSTPRGTPSKLPKSDGAKTMYRVSKVAGQILMVI